MFIYVIGPESGSQKIGFSQDVEKRLSSIQTGNPQKLKIHHKQEVRKEHVRLLEKKIHHANARKKVSGEWFDLTPEDAILEVTFAMIRWSDDPSLG